MQPLPHPLRHRHALAALAAALMFSPLSCALAVGIEDLSGSQADDSADICVTTINAHRAEAMLEPTDRWLEKEACAGQQATADATGATPMDCGAAWASCGIHSDDIEDV